MLKVWLALKNKSTLYSVLPSFSSPTTQKWRRWGHILNRAILRPILCVRFWGPGIAHNNLNWNGSSPNRPAGRRRSSGHHEWEKFEFEVFIYSRFVKISVNSVKYLRMWWWSYSMFNLILPVKNGDLLRTWNWFLRILTITRTNVQQKRSGRVNQRTKVPTVRLKDIELDRSLNTTCSIY